MPNCKTSCDFVIFVFLVFQFLVDIQSIERSGSLYRSYM